MLGVAGIEKQLEEPPGVLLSELAIPAVEDIGREFRSDIVEVTANVRGQESSMPRGDGEGTDAAASGIGFREPRSRRQNLGGEAVGLEPSTIRTAQA